MDWSLVPARKRTFNFWPVARGMKDVSMDGTMERKHGISRALVPPSMLRRCAARPASENAASAWSEIFSFLVGTRGLSGFKLIRVSPSKIIQLLIYLFFLLSLSTIKNFLFSLIVSSSSLSF